MLRHLRNWRFKKKDNNGIDIASAKMANLIIGEANFLAKSVNVLLLINELI